MAGLSVLMESWHSMQVAEGGRPSVSPGSGFTWQVLHASPKVPAWFLWLNGMGCSGASAAVAANTASARPTVHFTGNMPATISLLSSGLFQMLGDYAGVLQHRRILHAHVDRLADLLLRRLIVAAGRQRPGIGIECQHIGVGGHFAARQFE